MTAGEPEDDGDVRTDLRATLAHFDERRKKIVGGVLAVMIENPGRIREREWIAEQFTQVVLLASGLEDVDDAQDGLAQIQTYARENIAPILNACYRLFQVVAEDLAASAGEEGFTREDAMVRALEYFG